jgi:hypothetical protein
MLPKGGQAIGALARQKMKKTMTWNRSILGLIKQKIETLKKANRKRP